MLIDYRLVKIKNYCITLDIFKGDPVFFPPVIRNPHGGPSFKTITLSGIL